MPPLRVSLIDPSASTPPYDRLLAAALARAGAEVELLTSRFVYGPVPAAEGYVAHESFYRHSSAAGLGSRRRVPLKALAHIPDMVRVRSRLRLSDVAHWQWLTLPPVDRFLLGPRPGGRPRVITLHYPLPPPGEERALARQRGVLSAFDAVIVHTRGGAERLVADVGLAPELVHVIPHGPLDYLTGIPGQRPLPPDMRDVEAPVILFFGLLRDYKGVDTLLEAFTRLDGGAELWIAGMPRMPLEPLRELAAQAPGKVRFLPRFIPDPEIPALLRRADVLALPYRRIEQSGVLHAGLAFGKPMVLGDVGGFSEVGSRGAARLVPPGDPDALAAELTDLIEHPEAREELAAAARRAVEGEYGWDAIAARTIDLYRSIGAGSR
jgi:glycosyltransferase involved in cell wall biosynthesis